VADLEVELARETGVPPKTLRFYEAEGLLADPGRTSAGYRDYPPSATDRVRFIRRAQAAGLTFGQIGAVFAAATWPRGASPASRAANTAPIWPKEPGGLRPAFLDDRLAEVERRLAELDELRANLVELRRRAADLDPADGDASAICAAIPADDG
jgi:DNA-binding transcriptional MerR regulator